MKAPQQIVKHALAQSPHRLRHAVNFQLGKCGGHDREAAGNNRSAISAQSGKLKLFNIASPEQTITKILQSFLRDLPAAAFGSQVVQSDDVPQGACSAR